MCLINTTISSASVLHLILWIINTNEKFRVKSFFPANKQFSKTVSIYLAHVVGFSIIHLGNFIYTRLSKLNNNFPYILIYLPNRFAYLSSALHCSRISTLSSVASWLRLRFLTRKNICRKRVDSNTIELASKF